MKGRFEPTHGMSHSREYKSYHAMKQRCTNPLDPSWEDYGGKGVRVCQRWLESFENFLSDMGTRPAGMTLDRIETAGNYESNNCRWATPLEQNNNRSDNTPVTVNGVIYPSVNECCRAYDLPFSTFKNRIERGWDIERAATTPAANNSGQELVVAGVTYPTTASFLRAYSLSKKRFYEGLKRGLTPEQIANIK